MFDAFRRWNEDRKTRRAVQRMWEHPVYGPVGRYIHEVFADTTNGIGKNWSEKGKADIFRNIIKDVGEQLSASEPVQAVRMRAIGFMLMAAEFDVLIMEPPTPHPHLSGALKPHIPTLAVKNEKLRKFFADFERPLTTPDELWDASLMRYWFAHLNMNAFNHVRGVLGDWSKDDTNDWFRPCYWSLCIHQENIYRRDLEMPSSIPGDTVGLRALMHSTWVNRAEEGHKDLLSVWERSWEDAFEEVSPHRASAAQ